MDVAQALTEHEKHVRELSTSPAVEPTPPPAFIEDLGTKDIPVNETKADEDDATTEVAPVSPVRERNGALSPQRMEQRKSSYEKYSAFIMPPLHEETTPVQSPANTLNRAPALATLQESPHRESEFVPPVPAVGAAPVEEDLVYISE